MRLWWNSGFPGGCRFALNSQAEDNIPLARLPLSPSPSVAVFRVGSKRGAHSKNGGQRRGRAISVFLWFVRFPLEPERAGEGAVAFCFAFFKCFCLLDQLKVIGQQSNKSAFLRFFRRFRKNWQPFLEVAEKDIIPLGQCDQRYLGRIGC